VRQVSGGQLCAWRCGQAPRWSGGAQGCDSVVRERMEKADHEEALPAVDGEEVDGGFGPSFRGRWLERCSTQRRFLGVEGRRAEAVVDGSGGGSVRPSVEQSG
jgi:hypothetical protein